MNFKIYTDSVNYTTQVVKINNLRKHSNADRLQVTTIQGNNVICGLDTKVGDLVLFFPVESQLAEDFAVKNDLVRRKDESGKQVGGMFELHRRVRCISLRGEKSEGFICPLSYLGNLGIDYLKIEDGSEFNEIDGIKICQKYIPKNNNSINHNQKLGKKAKHESKIIEGQFHFHYDTEKFARHVNKFKLNDLIVITQKLHGSSFVSSNILCKKKLNLFEKILSKLGVSIQTTIYDNIYSSRRVLKNTDLNYQIHYYSEDIWSAVNDKVKNFLEKTITVYGEIVGYTKNGGHIQSGYSYGCKVGDLDFYIYRITSTNEDGKVIEFNWQQIKYYCNKYGLKHVPELFYGKVSEFIEKIAKVEIPNQENFHDLFLKELEREYLGKTLPEGVPDEGIVLRNEFTDYIAYKMKDFKFLAKESSALDNGDVGLEDS